MLGCEVSDATSPSESVAHRGVLELRKLHFCRMPQSLRSVADLLMCHNLAVVQIERESPDRDKRLRRRVARLLVEIHMALEAVDTQKELDSAGKQQCTAAFFF